MSDKLKDLILGLGFLVVGATALISIRSSGGGTRIDSAAKLTYATMPTVYAWILILLVSLFILKTLLSIRKERILNRQDKSREIEKPEQGPLIVSPQLILLRTWATLVILFCFVFLLEYIHFLVLTILFLASLFFLYGQRSIKKVTTVSICGGVVYYIVFIYILNLPF